MFSSWLVAASHIHTPWQADEMSGGDWSALRWCCWYAQRCTNKLVPHYGLTLAAQPHPLGKHGPLPHSRLCGALAAELLESHMCGRVTKLCPLKKRPAPEPAEGGAAAGADAPATPPAGAGDEMVIDGDAAEVQDNPEAAAVGGGDGEDRSEL